MQTKIAIIGIIVENMTNVEKINSLFHSYNQYIIGRMGMPYSQKEVNIISIVLDAPPDIISALSGKIGRLEGVTSKTAIAKL